MFMVHEKILASFVKAEIEGGRVSAIHWNKQNDFFKALKIAIKAVNIIVSIYAPCFKTLITAMTAPMCVQIRIINNFILRRLDKINDLSAVAGFSC